MIRKTKNITAKRGEAADEYNEFIKKSVKEGSYFKDAVDWYFMRYISPFCERTILIFAAVVSVIVLFYLTELIKGTFPLEEEFPVIIKAKDQSLYFPHLISIGSKVIKNCYC